MTKRKFRIGDLVEYSWWNKNDEPVRRIGIIKATSEMFWVINHHLDINNCIIDSRSCKLITKREKLKEWWKYL